MPLTWRIDTAARGAHVALQGRPDAGSLADLQQLLVRLIRRWPGDVTVDLSSLTPPARTRLLSAVRPVGDGRLIQDTKMLLFTKPSADSANSQAAASSAGHRLRSQLSDAAAQAWRPIVHGPLRSPSITEHLLPLPGAARQARNAVTGACLAWDLSAMTVSATLLASELVSHTITHVATMLTLVILLDGDVLYLWVRGGSWQQPSLPADDKDSLTMGLINAVAACWGQFPDGDDLVTWAALPITARTS